MPKRRRPSIKGEIPEGASRTEAGFAWLKAKNGKCFKKTAFYLTYIEYETIAIFRKEANSYAELYSLLPYAQTECNIIKYYEDAGVPYEDFNPIPYDEMKFKGMSFAEFVARERKNGAVIYMRDDRITI